MWNIQKSEFEHISMLADELENTWISDEHFDETKKLLDKNKHKSAEIAESISMTREKFYKPFDL